jgi:rSAM/selenodomain-associated transferase 2
VHKSFSVIIPVFEESSIINKTIEHVYQTGSGFDLEVIIVDGDVRGDTIRTITNNSTLRITAGRGRGSQMNKGASMAGGDILVFLHADTVLPVDAFEAISSLLRADEYVGGAFDLGIQSGRLIYRVIERAVLIRTRLTRVPYGDQAIFIKRDYFEKVRGFPAIPLMEDVAFMRRLKKDGYNIGIIPMKAYTSPRRWEKEGVLFCTLRNWTLLSLYLLGADPQKLERFYYRHRHRHHGIKTP